MYGLADGHGSRAAITKAAARAAGVVPKRDAARNLKKDSPSKKLLQGEWNHLRRDLKRREHNQDRLGSHLSNLAGTHSEFLRADVLAVSHPDAQDD